MAALVGGVALKKVGVIALILAFFAKFAKLGVLVALGLFGGVTRLFRRKRNGEGGD